MAECPGSRTIRGTRSQFRLGLPGLGQCKGLYPIHLGDIMDSGQSSQTGISSSKDLISPSKGTRTLTVREYEQTISELQKENFDLKLKLFLYDESTKKVRKDGCTPEKENIRVVVRVNSEIDSLQNELSYKEKLLHEAVDRAEKLELNLKEIEKKYADLQCELSSLSELPSKEEFLDLVGEKETLITYNESLEKTLIEKEEEINNLNQKLEMLAEQNRVLDEKVKKRSLALQGFVCNNYKEKEMLPDDLKKIVISAAQAAKNKNKNDLAIAVKRIDSALNQMMTASILSVNEPQEKENIESPQEKCLKEDTLEKSCPSLSSQMKSSTESNHIQSLKEVLDERNTPAVKQVNALDPDVLDLSIEKSLNENAASTLHSVYIQTDIVGCNLLNEYDMQKLQKDAKLSSNVEELREDILLLLLTIEDKNKELSEVKQSLSIVQDDLKKALNTTSMLDKDYYINERNELHEKLALSSSVNEKLMKHLKCLEKFMDDLLHNKFDSSLESLTSSISQCLNESLNLSSVLSDHLSFCEGSKLFEECESFVYKNGSYSDEKGLPHLNLSEMLIPEQDSSYSGTHFLEEYVPYIHKGDQNKKESDDSQLCWRCWQQLNTSVNQSEAPHLIQNNIVSNHIVYPSSDSDIWSEPDRNVSMQRIGISLQNSPVSSKSPRKLKQKDKRMSCRLSSEQDTSSVELQRASKKRHGSASRRLFSKESIKSQDFTSEKFYFLLAERYSKLKSLLDKLENIKDGEISDDVWIKLNKIMACLGEAIQKLHIARENAKNFPSAVCGKCVMLELFADLKASYKESDFFFNDSSSEQEILQEFLREISLLKDACREAFPLFSETVSKISDSTECNTIIKNEQIKINELEDTVVDLNSKNKELNKTLESTKRLLTEERKVLESFKTENVKLSDQINHLKEELLATKEQEKELVLKNENLLQELAQVNRNNSELNKTLEHLEKRRQESGIELDQLTTELQKNRSDLVLLNEKYLRCEQQLNEQISIKEKCERQLDEEIHKKKECENKLKNLESTSVSEKNSYLNQIYDLNAEKNRYIHELKNIQEKQLALENENLSINDSLQFKNNEILYLKKTMEDLQDSKESLNSYCRELQIELKYAKENLADLQKRFSSEEELLMKFKENEIKYSQQLKQLETKSLSEKKRLVDEISSLKNEREEILQKLNHEKECYKKLKSEKTELDENYTKSSQQISTLKLLNEELKSKQLNLLQRNQFFENALLSSNNECDILNKDLKFMRDTLQNLESKCLMYEKQLVATAGMKDSLVECLLMINNEFSVHGQKLNEVCKAYGSENYILWDDISVDEDVPVIDANNVQRLCENICFKTKKLSQSVDMLLELLKGFYLKSVEAKSSDEKNKIKITSTAKEMESHRGEMEYLKSQNANLQCVIDELQQSVSEKEKSVQFSAYEIQSMKEKLYNTEKEITKNNELLQIKDDEITMLQERIFNLQTYLNSVMTDNINLTETNTSIVDKPSRDSVSSDNQLPSEPVVLNTSKMCQTNEFENIIQSADESFTSSSSHETSRNSCCDKYWKKCHSLQKKLAFSRKHIEILEKDKNDLRESLLQQLQNKKDLSEEKDSSKLAELESKLEKKKGFIIDLKGELLKTWNSLIDKEKDLDDLKQKLADYESKSKHAAFNTSARHSITTPKSFDVNIETLTKSKWKLIQTIFDIQRKFYEKRGIHLNYFDRFKDHVNNLYSIQLTHTLSKSESLPVLESHVLKQQHGKYDPVKSIASLELDIQCLVNLKIFLDRFLLPCVLDTPKTADRKVIDFTDKETSFDKLLQTTVEGLKDSKCGMMDILNISFPEVHSSTHHEESLQEKVIRFESFVSTISHHLDCIEKFFIAVKKYQGLDNLDLYTEDSVQNAEVKSLLINILEEIKILHEGASKLFDSNALLKTFGFPTASPIPLSARPDVSDRESVMSDETIAISRTESPLSFEDVCPIKLPPPETLQLEQKTFKPDSSKKIVTVVDPYNKMTAIGSSCDSVCQRSHYSSPDLGIESDPNHDSSAPEQKDDLTKYQKPIIEDPKFIVKSPQKSAYISTESTGSWPDHKFGETLYAICILQHFELLKKQVTESLVAIKSVLSRTGDGLHHIGKYTSPRKTLEYNTLKSIKDSCAYIEVCLKKAAGLIGKFWTAPCPSEKEWKILNDENQNLLEQLVKLKDMIQKQENDFNKAKVKLEHAHVQKANMEKKIAKKLVKTKKVIRQAELKLLENRCQNFPPIPKFPSDQTEPKSTAQQM